MIDRAPPPNPSAGILPPQAAPSPDGSSPNGVPGSVHSVPGTPPRSGRTAWLDGRKTYLLAILGAVYVLGADLGWWPFDDLVIAILGFGGLSALRHGVTKSQSP